MSTALREEKEVTQTDVAQAIIDAREAQLLWAARPLQDRLGLLRSFRHLLVDSAAAVAAELPALNGAARVEKMAAEVAPIADACLFLERQAGKILRPRKVGLLGRPVWLVGVHAEVRREPFGVILIIGPSNYPLLLPGVQALQALAAGNAVLLKPGEGGSPVAQAFARLMREAGLDPRLLKILPETVESGRQAMEAGVDKVVLTGSARAGQAVLRSLADQLTPSTMELSGCDAAFLQPDADLDLVAKSLEFGLLWNRSETCIAPRRVFVPHALAASLEEKLVSRLAGVTVEPTRTRAGASTARLVADAIQQGARHVSGTLLADGSGLTPSVVADVTSEMLLIREESFAPVVALIPVHNEDEALEIAATCPFGLGATIFGNVGTAKEFAGRIPAGSIVINDMIVPTADPRLPFGGRGRSGFGSTRGVEGLLEMTTTKVISVKRGSIYQHFDRLTEADEGFFLAYLQAFHGRSMWSRWRSRLTFARLLMKRLWK